MKHILMILVVVSAQQLSHAQVSVSALSLPYGKYQAGFTHYTRNDSTRSYTRINDFTGKILPRPIPVSAWYPAVITKKKKTMTIADYMIVLKEEEEWEALPNHRILDWFYYSNTASNQQHLTEQTKGSYNLAAVPKKFPVVIYAPSYQASSAENFALCEFLATHGFIVVSSPSRGTDARFLDGATTRDMETQARDIQFLIAEIAKNKLADLDDLAVIGYSFGGISNILAAMMDKRIKNVVCLDGSIRYQLSKIQQSPYFNMKAFDVPFLFMAQKTIPEQVMKEDQLDASLNSDFAFYDSLKNNNAYYLRFNDLTHTYFSSMGILFAERDLRQDKSDTTIMKSYRWMCSYALHFLDAFVNKSKDAKAFLAKTPLENGIPGESIAKLSEKNGRSKEFGFNEFNIMALKQQYLHLPELLATVKRSHPDFRIEEWKLNTLGLSLLFKNNLQAGISVLHFNTTLFPQSANTYDSLGEGYLITEQNDKAAENFKKSLALDPSNQNAINRLKNLDK